MKRSLRGRLLAAIPGLLLVVWCALSSGGLSTTAAGPDGDCLPSATRRELASARSATARYRDISRAMEDGYVDINVFVPGMGFHYLKSSILDAEFEVDKPELLVYANRGHRLQLVAVEYAVPTNLSATAPEGFTGCNDVWHLNTEFGLWTLHAWIWLHNPDGMFEELNPRLF